MIEKEFLTEEELEKLLKESNELYSELDPDEEARQKIQKQIAENTAGIGKGFVLGNTKKT